MRARILQKPAVFPCCEFTAYSPRPKAPSIAFSAVITLYNQHVNVTHWHCSVLGPLRPLSSGI